MLLLPFNKKKTKNFRKTLIIVIISIFFMLSTPRQNLSFSIAKIFNKATNTISGITTILENAENITPSSNWQINGHSASFTPNKNAKTGNYAIKWNQNFDNGKNKPLIYDLSAKKKKSKKLQTAYLPSKIRKQQKYQM